MNIIMSAIKGFFAVLLGIAVYIGLCLFMAFNWSMAINHVWTIYATYYLLPQLPLAIFLGLATLANLFTYISVARLWYSMWCRITDNQTDEQIANDRNTSLLSVIFAPWIIVGFLHLYLCVFPLKPIVWPETTSTHVGTAAHVEPTP